MNPHRRCYLQSVLGGAAGLAAWILVTIMSFFTVLGRLGGDFVAAGIFGLLVGGAIAGTEEIREQRPYFPWILYGSLLGLVGGLLATASYLPIDASIRDGAPEWNRLIQWVAFVGVTGAFIGFRWIRRKPQRLALSVLGGCCGGLAGGIMIGFLSGSPDVSPAVAYMAAGAGLGWGYSFTPLEPHAAVLRFVRSSDERTNHKLKRLEPWNIDAAVSVLLGNPTEGESTSPTTDVFVPVWDPKVAANHARLFSRQGQFILSRHPDIRSQGALARYILRVGDRSVSREQALENGDEIRIGATVFRIDLVREEY